MKKTSKAQVVKGLLEQGHSVKTIKKLAKTSESYIYLIKKKLEEMADMAGEAINEATAVVKEVIIPKVDKVDTILDERAATYGAFNYVAEIAQEIKDIVRVADTNRDELLAYDQREALDMIASKIGRILGGNADYVDSWIDIAGYATLIADRLEGKPR
jgi:hypothetical protein